mmetsp:Transcript_31513/g.104055  ORF Transcript_31513/g.104055 Transcript_31513/m.104055 type:complete len:306 (+) Transcript_31513:1608-2525(+)
MYGESFRKRLPKRNFLCGGGGWHTPNTRHTARASSRRRSSSRVLGAFRRRSLDLPRQIGPPPARGDLRGCPAVVVAQGRVDPAPQEQRHCKGLAVAGGGVQRGGVGGVGGVDHRADREEPLHHSHLPLGSAPVQRGVPDAARCSVDDVAARRSEDGLERRSVGPFGGVDPASGRVSAHARPTRRGRQARRKPAAVRVRVRVLHGPRRAGSLVASSLAAATLSVAPAPLPRVIGYPVLVAAAAARAAVLAPLSAAQPRAEPLEPLQERRVLRLDLQARLVGAQGVGMAAEELERGGAARMPLWRGR